MADRPIIFSAPMVAALRAGTKTQTRRELKLPTKTEGGFPIYERPDMGGWEPTTVGGGGCTLLDGTPAPEKIAIWHQTTGICMLTPIQPGDRLWVRESYFQFGHWEPIAGAKTKGGRQKWGFVADRREILFDAPAEHRKGMHSADPATPAWHKRLGRFMPRSASRMTLLVTEVRVQRLQECSEEDAIAEGIVCQNVIVGMACYGGPPCEITADRYFFDGCDDEGFEDAVSAYAALWDSINGAGAWDANPWVVAYSFSVEPRNIDTPACLPAFEEA